ncbi:MAG TPA: cytochrome c-type biogenesis CcmF C-terminal domain-containing protein [Polyangia bacterium]
MAAFGTLTLLIALVVATYGGVASVIGARRRNPRLIESGRASAYALAGILGLASASIMYAFLTNDFSIKYVQRTSDVATPLFYKITAYWGGLDGSILWWVFLLATFSAIAIYSNRNRHREILPYAVATLMVIVDFFLFLIIFHKNPFDTYMATAPLKGEGLNPLLQNFYMATHPPSLYIGFVGMSIPFAFAMGALISGHLDDAWIGAVRRWTLISWFFLATGLTLGMLWAYEELGWGGFWAWDPVENAGFLPWLTATAFFHSTMIQERRGMMKVWNFSLVILTFFLTIFGTFMTRSGIVQSVHAFGEDKKLAWMFTFFMAFLLIVSFGFLIRRLPELRSRATLESPLSREAAFLVNNWILLLAAFFVLFATMFPTLSEAITGERISVGPPFFNQWMVPIGLVLLLLTGIGPLIAWRKATVSHLRYQFTWPGIATVAAVALCLYWGLGSSSIAAIICFAFCAFTAATVVQEFARGAQVRRKNTGSDYMTALLGMILRGRRRYGGYLVHLGIVLMFLGFAGQAYQKEEEQHLRPGQAVPFGKYQVRFDRLRHEEDRQKEMLTADFTIMAEGKELGKMHPARWYFNGRNGEFTTEVAIRRSAAEDLYITLGGVDFADGSGTFKLVINPLVDWVWFGFILLALGTTAALLPETALAPVAARAGIPARGVGATGILVLIGLSLFAGMRPAHAAVDPGFIKSEMEWFGKNLRCMCSMGGRGCGHMLEDCGAECGGAPQDRQEILNLLTQGKSRQEIIDLFIKREGGAHVLGAPPDTGFNRHAWALPYGLGILGAGALAFTAWRYSNRHKEPEPAETAATEKSLSNDTALEDRLEDELSRVDS